MKNIYLCGPTVYNTPHIGNMRPIITFDLFIRALNAQGIKTNLIHNITDIDDKIIKKAQEENTTEIEISERYTAKYKELLINYNILSPNSMPKVTESLPSIIKFIEELISTGAAYESNGDVYFAVESLKSYGSISNRKLDEMNFENSNHKKHPGDFALWKNTSEGIQYDSPWSKGRPGWHTECSAFINNELKGQTLDIHGGGIDLIFPHHENEAAQYKALTGNDIAKEWKHIGQLSLDGEKMSKSLGNTFAADEFADEIGTDVLRMLFLTSSVTGPIDLKKQTLEQLKAKTEKWATIFAKTQLENVQEVDVSDVAKLISNWKFSEANKQINENIFIFNKNNTNASKVFSLMKMLGFNFTKNLITPEIKGKYQEWASLREESKYEEADKLREELLEYKLI